MRIGIMRALYAPVGDGTGGGGTGDGAGDEEPPFSDEQLEAMNKVIGSRLGDGFKSFEKKMLGSIETTLATLATTIDTSLDTKIAALAPPSGDGKGKGKGGGDAPPDITEHPVVKGLQKQLADLTTKAKTSEDTAAAERAKSRAKDLRSRLGDMLAASGVKDPSRNKAAVTNLIAEGRVAWSEDDAEALVFNDSDGAVDIKTGLTSWSKSDDAKIYIAPSTAQGSGDRGGGKGPGGKGTPYKRGDFGAALMAEAGGLQLIVGPGQAAKSGA